MKKQFTYKDLKLKTTKQKIEFLLSKNVKYWEFPSYKNGKIPANKFYSFINDIISYLLNHTICKRLVIKNNYE